MDKYIDLGLILDNNDFKLKGLAMKFAIKCSALIGG